MRKSKPWFCIVLFAVAAAVLARPAAAQDWPAKPIRAFIPFAAGSATDIIPRAVFDQLSPVLGQPIVIENRGGAGGALGVGEVTRAEPDGYTILADSSALTVAPWIVTDLPYDTAKDLSAVIPLGKNGNVLVVNPAKGWKTVQDLVAAAKANPGTINYGSAGVGTATHVSAERFRASAGFEATHIPYKGGAEALTDLLGGRIDFYFCPISTALPLIHDGRLTALAISTPTRASDLPDVPTTLEAGYPDSDYTVWYGVFMPAKTPRDIVQKFYAVASRVLQSPAMQQKLKQLAVDPFPMRPEQFDQYVVKDLDTNGRLFRTATKK
ncbi:MAG TPA: tripartite tricarboxylate transporter substrate binding protein [Xanthobacteraceae bacterium]|jgi:tripartite-type tricarboxylate transporter receptor subunit TctC|nr:tripartite tricarboxylate transporter substrate binding protein [Xanthobacteraceae bacterium]